MIIDMETSKGKQYFLWACRLIKEAGTLDDEALAEYLSYRIPSIGNNMKANINTGAGIRWTAKEVQTLKAELDIIFAALEKRSGHTREEILSHIN
jgi:hypothetical protein